MLRARIEVWNDETNENIAINAQGADAGEISTDAGQKFHVALANLNVLPVTAPPPADDAHVAAGSSLFSDPTQVAPAVDPALVLDPEAPK